MKGLPIAESRLNAEKFEAHHRVRMEIRGVQNELHELKDQEIINYLSKDGALNKRFQRPEYLSSPETKNGKVTDLPRVASAMKLRFCACGCGAQRFCGADEEESDSPLDSINPKWLQAPTAAICAVAQRAYNERLAQPRKPKEAAESSRPCSKLGVVDHAYLEQLAMPRERAREQRIKREAGPVPKLPNLGMLQHKVLVADEGHARKQVKDPGMAIRAGSAPKFAPHLLPVNKGDVIPSQVDPVMPRPQRRLVSRNKACFQGMEDLPGLGGLLVRHAVDKNIPKTSAVPQNVKSSSSASPSPGPVRGAPEPVARSRSAQQSYINQRLVPPKFQGKQQALLMRLEALRNERLAREALAAEPDLT